MLPLKSREDVGTTSAKRRMVSIMNAFRRRRSLADQTKGISLTRGFFSLGWSYYVFLPEKSFVRWSLKSYVNFIAIVLREREKSFVPLWKTEEKCRYIAWDFAANFPSISPSGRKEHSEMSLLIALASVRLKWNRCECCERHRENYRVWRECATTTRRSPRRFAESVIKGV